MDEPVKPTRRYDSPRRREQASVTRRDILAAAQRLFEEQGYAATTMAAIAGAAGVALKTVYVAFDTKSGVLRALWHLLLRGDENRPVGERSWHLEVLSEHDPERKLRLNAHNSRVVKERAGGLLGVIRDAAATDPDIDELWDRIQTEFYALQRQVVESLHERGALAPGLDVARATDILWTLNHPDVWQLLPAAAAGASAQYEHWFGDTTCAQLLRSAAAAARRWCCCTASPTRGGRGSCAAGAGAPPRRAGADAAGHAGGPPLDGESRRTGSPTRSSGRWTRPASTAHVAGNSLGGYVALQLAARGRARDRRRARAGRRLGAATPPARRSPLHAELIASCGRRAARRRDPGHARGPPPRDAVHRPSLRAHPGRAARPPDPRRRSPATAPALIEHALREGWAARRRADRLPGAGRLGHRGPGPAVALGRRALPRRVAPARRLGRARRRRPLPAARRPARDGAADPRLHLGGSDSA